MKATFSFGENWHNYVKNVVDAAILEESKMSLLRYLPQSEFKEKIFIDVGCGSGLFSLSALLLGSKKVVSFDYDRNSVAAANYLRDKFSNIIPKDTQWDISQGSILSEETISSLPQQADIVYSWGVLHHTGNMWKAINNALGLVGQDKYFIISIYNKTPASRFWLGVKQFYNRAPLFQPLLIAAYGFCFCLAHMIKNRTFNLRKERGMHVFYDVIDWLGGYPYEYAYPDEIKGFVENKGFKLIDMPTRFPRHTGKNSFFSRISPANTGCNEFIFKRIKNGSS